MDKHRNLQIMQVSIVEDIDKICEEYGLRYYMIGGTLLGAVRHKGFIPWDDDIDLVMYRQDYDKLIKILQDRYSEKYFVQTFNSDRHYTRYIAKVRLNGTRLVESYLEGAKSHSGIYVDIFPLDNTRKCDGVGLEIRGKVVRCLFAYKTIKHNAMVKKSGLKFYLGKFLRFFTYVVPESLVNKLFDFVCEMDNSKDCNFTTNFASHFKWKKQMFPNEVFGDGCRLEFEGHMFNAPDKYIEILERLYGKNYMELPPEEKRESHNIVELDLGVYDFAK